MELRQILLRVVFTYVFMFILLRLCGKRGVRQATSFDFVLVLILGDLLDDVLWAEVPVSQFVVAAGTLVLLEVIIGLASYASETFSRIVDSQADLFMVDGGLIQSGMRRERMNEKDAEMMLRRQASLERRRWPEVKNARIEGDGHPSALKHEWAREAQQRVRGSLPMKKR
jgi:uncharacterized membrane protein YcaP (DUF421 family)